jgi:predicted ATPase
VNQPVTRIRARNFRSLRDIDVRLGPLSVLIGPNGSGKTNVLNVLRFLATTARFDLAAALDDWRGIEHVQRQAAETGPVRLAVDGLVTPHTGPDAPDSYTLTLTRHNRVVSREEEFSFERGDGRGRRITVKGATATVAEGGTALFSRELATEQTTGLATLPKLSDDDGGLGIRSFAELLSTFRVLEPDIAAARRPTRSLGNSLADDAGNLADALARLRRRDPDAFGLLSHDLGMCLPGLGGIEVVPVGGPGRAVTVQLIEEGVTQPVELADASFGTVRLLAILTALHEPDPPPLTAIEEVDHGLHPYAMDILVDRMRAASRRTQILAATHSPTLVNRLHPEEIIVCDRDKETGASIIPAVSAEAIRAAVDESQWRAGELWFAGALHGVPG